MSWPEGERCAKNRLARKLTRNQGKWTVPKIPNPEYKGVWAPAKIANPQFFEDSSPADFTKIGGIGIELWTMTEDILCEFNTRLCSKWECKAKSRSGGSDGGFSGAMSGMSRVCRLGSGRTLKHGGTAAV